jgi:hypothetical protein
LQARLAQEGKPNPELKQVWFPGCHINIGGGADDAITDMKGDLERKSYLHLYMWPLAYGVLDLSTASFTWMLQCISPHLTVDPTAFFAWSAQYQRWLARIRYACTYHHTTWLDTIKSKLPNIPLINPVPNPLAPPPRDHTHTHPEFEYGWGTGPIIDSYGGMYKLAGAVPRAPGHCQAELYDAASAEAKMDDINKFGLTHEYIHPICEYRRVVRSHEERTSALRAFTRKFEPTDGTRKGRFWWYMDGESKGLPEWVILEHGKYGGVDLDGCGKGEINFERSWYEACEKTEKTLAVLKKAGYERDFLSMVDERIDFGVGEKEGWVYP